MESFFQKRSLARSYVRQLLQSNLNAQSRHQIFEALKQFRRRNISPSTAVATVHNLLRDNADLLPGFDPFMPKINPPTVAAVEEDSILQSSLDFLNRVRTRFPDGQVYKEFLNCLHSHSRGETSFSQIYDHVIMLFRNNPDLVSDFKSFLQISSDQQQVCKKRKAADSPISSNQKRNCKKRKTGSQKSCKKRKSDVDEGATEKRQYCPDSRRKQERITSNNQNIDNGMEDSLFELDVELGNVRAALTNAEQLKQRLSDGFISPADVRLGEHFTALNTVCIKRTYTKFLEYYNENHPICAMEELIGRLRRKEKEVEESRERICEKWNRIRQSRDPNWNHCYLRSKLLGFLYSCS